MDQFSKIRYRIIGLAVAASLIFWILDAVLDKLIFYDEPFSEVIIGNEQEIAFRLLTSAFFIAFGIFAARAFSKQKSVEQSLKLEIEQRKKAEDAVRISEGKFRSVIESTDDYVYLVDRDFKYLYMNLNYATRMGFTGDEYIGRSYFDIHLPTEVQWFKNTAEKVFLQGKSVHEEYKSRRDNRCYLLTFSPVEGPGGEVVSVTVISKDITNLKLMEEQLHALSITDELTGLLNRRGFFDVASRFLKMASRRNTGAYLLYIDLDNLKMINDSFGHVAGDLAIKEMAAALRDCFRNSDIVARVGGDEFVVFPVETASANIELITGRLHERLNTRNETSAHGFTLSASCGAALYDPEKPGSLDDLLMQADEDMYRQKTDRKKT